MPSNVSEFTHKQSTWKIYPRVYRFQYWFNDLHKRFKGLTTGEPQSSVFKGSHLTKKLETLSSLLGNGLQVKVIGKRDIDPQKFSIASEELSQTNAQTKSLFSRKGSLRAKSTDPGITGITFVICYAKVKDFNSEGLQKVLDTLKYFKSTEEQVRPDDMASLFILYETSSSKNVDEIKCAKFCSDILTAALKTFGLNLKVENIIVNPVGNILGCKISDVLEKRIIQGFVDISTQLYEYIGDRHFDMNLMDIVETDHFLCPIQGYLRNGLAYPLRDDIKKAFETFEDNRNSIRKASLTMRKMLFEVQGHLSQFKLNQNKPTQATIPDKLREEIMAINGVFGMGTVFGRIEIHLKDGITENDVVQDVLKKMEYFNFSEPVRFVKVLQMPKKLCSESGNYIGSRCSEAIGDSTLGCFAQRDGFAALYALTSVEHDVFITNVNDGRRVFAISHPAFIIKG